MLVVICFHFTIFVVLETTAVPRRVRRGALWFAFILLSLSYWKQRFPLYPSGATGCDLLSFYYLCRTGNNCNRQPAFHTWLWFAFILLSLSYWKQQQNYKLKSNSRCDLLSFYYLCRTGNNYNDLRGLLLHVVICFHFTIFVVLETTEEVNTALVRLLWFAFILLSLSYWKQLPQPEEWREARCDLLSFYYLCRTGNNTTVTPCRTFSLWFAFILLSLSYWKQLGRAPPFFTIGCDLLSFYYLCRTGNNEVTGSNFTGTVVICFHFTIFVVLETTPLPNCPRHQLLWFAFILLSLSYWKQPGRALHFITIGCDLLSFYYLCRTGNNVVA